MNATERRRLTVFSRVRERAISVAEAGRLLELSERQARRLWKRYRERGDAGLIHGLRGRPGTPVMVCSRPRCWRPAPEFTPHPAFAIVRVSCGRGEIGRRGARFRFGAGNSVEVRLLSPAIPKKTARCLAGRFHCWKFSSIPVFIHLRPSRPVCRGPRPSRGADVALHEIPLIILRLNAGMSAGFRLVTSPRSATTSSSVHFAPAFLANPSAMTASLSCSCPAPPRPQFDSVQGRGRSPRSACPNRQTPAQTAPLPR